MSLKLCFLGLEGAEYQIVCNARWPRSQDRPWPVTRDRHVALADLRLELWRRFETRLRRPYAADPLKVAITFGRASVIVGAFMGIMGRREPLSFLVNLPISNNRLRPVAPYSSPKRK